MVMKAGDGPSPAVHIPAQKNVAERKASPPVTKAVAVAQEVSHGAVFETGPAPHPGEIIELGNAPPRAGLVHRGSWLEALGIPAGSQVLSVDGTPVSSAHPLGELLDSPGPTGANRTEATLVIGTPDAAQRLVLRRDTATGSWSRAGEPKVLGGYWPGLADVPIVTGYRLSLYDSSGTFGEPASVTSNEDLRLAEEIPVGHHALLTLLDGSQVTLLGMEDSPPVIVSRGREIEQTLEEQRDLAERATRRLRDSATWFGASATWTPEGLSFDATSPCVPGNAAGIEPGDVLERIGDTPIRLDDTGEPDRWAVENALAHAAESGKLTLHVRRPNGKGGETTKALTLQALPFQLSALSELRQRLVAPAVLPGDFLQKAGVPVGWLVTGMRKAGQGDLLPPGDIEEVASLAKESGALELEALGPEGLMEVLLHPPAGPGEPWTAQSTNAQALVSAVVLPALSEVPRLVDAGIPEGTLIDQVRTPPSDYEQLLQQQTPAKLEADTAQQAANEEAAADFADQVRPVLETLEEQQRRFLAILGDRTASPDALAHRLEEALLTAPKGEGPTEAVAEAGASEEVAPSEDKQKLAERARILCAVADALDTTEQRKKSEGWDDAVLDFARERLLVILDAADNIPSTTLVEVRSSIDSLLKTLPGEETPNTVGTTDSLQKRAGVLREARTALEPLLQQADQASSGQPKPKRPTQGASKNGSGTFGPEHLATLSAALRRYQQLNGGGGTPDNAASPKLPRSAVDRLNDGLNEALGLVKQTADDVSKQAVEPFWANYVLERLAVVRRSLNEALLSATSESTVDEAWDDFRGAVEDLKKQLTAQAKAGQGAASPTFSGPKWNVEQARSATDLNNLLSRKYSDDVVELVSTRLGMSWHLKKTDGGWRTYDFTSAKAPDAKARDAKANARAGSFR